MVCEYLRQERRRMSFDWKTKTTPMRELNRRKLADMVPRLNSGLSFESWSCMSWTVSPAESTGRTWERSL